MKLAFGNVVSQEFRDRVLVIVRQFGWSDEHASWLMACIAFESAGTFSPSIKNAAGSGATGLIQFMPQTAIGLGTTVKKLAAMDAVTQLDWVQLYFRPYAARIKSLSDMYMAILLPGAIGKSDDEALFTTGIAYRQNAALDADNDGIITKAEATGRVTATLLKGMQPPNVYEIQPKEKPMLPAIATQILGAFLPILTSKVPELGAILNVAGAAQNPAVVDKVGSVLMQSTGATNMQDAVERIQADPQTAKEAGEALRANRADIADLVERMAKLDEDSVAAARTFYKGEKPVIGNWMFVQILSLLLTVIGSIFAGVVMFTSTDPSERTMVLQVILMTGFVSVVGFWLGSSRSSQMKDMMK